MLPDVSSPVRGRGLKPNTRNTRKIGLLGGTLDPIHHGHLLLACSAQEQVALDEVIFIPAAQSPLKDGAYATAEDRWAMVQLALADQPDFYGFTG